MLYGGCRIIIILSAHDDPHVPYVLPILHDRCAKVLWFDPGQFPSNSRISLDFDGCGYFRKRLIVEGQTIDLDEVTAIWLRRPNPVEADLSVHDSGLREWVHETASDTLNGLFELLDCLWLPAKPKVSLAAGNKLSQLQVAAEIGFRVPRTCITNSPDAFLDFYEETEGQLIAKQVSGAVAWGSDGQPIPTYTTVVRRRYALNAQLVRYTPTIFQEYVPKRLELRVTVVGYRIFSVAIDSQNNRVTKHDWRHYDDRATYTPHQLPSDIEEKCFRLLHKYGLTYGAIDMILTPEGEYVFLEINPNGQWGWIADLTDLPIADAVAELLLRGLYLPGEVPNAIAF